MIPRTTRRSACPRVAGLGRWRTSPAALSPTTPFPTPGLFPARPWAPPTASPPPLPLPSPRCPRAWPHRYDASIYKSKTTGRGPLAPGWETTHAPVMTCYKLVRAQFKYFGAQTKVENTIIKSQRDLFARTLGSSFCMIDEWNGLTIADIRRLEATAAAELNASVLSASPVPGPAAVELAHAAHHDAGAGAGGAGAGGAGGATGGATAGAADDKDAAAAPAAAAGAEPALST